MSANIFGERFRLMSFGESHGVALGAVIDGCPAGVPVDLELLRKELDRRRPGQSSLTSARQEKDQAEILSGVYEGKTLGTPIALIVRNEDARSQDYAKIAQSPRAGHADDVWKEKFQHSDPRGGGRSSGRETLARVLGGAFAQMFLQETHPQMKVHGRIAQVGDLRIPEGDQAIWSQAETKIHGAREAGDSLGGIAEIKISSPPKSLGQPVFHKLKADLAGAMMGVGATSAVEIGEGVGVSEHRGIDFHAKSDGAVYGGIRGGISTGEEILLRVHFKPTSSILDVAKKGRHDPFIVTRAIPVLESMAWLVLADHALWSRTDRVADL